MPTVTRPAVPIAIIGIGCRLPGGVRDAASYWDLLTHKRCAIREIPPERWSLDGFYEPSLDRPDRSYSKWGGFLDDVAGFDPGWFGLSPREAEGMDPQQRLLLMAAVEAAQDGRVPLSALRAVPTGVFIGVSNIDYGLLQRYRPGQGEMQAGTGTALSIVANRVSNRLDLSGPSMGIDTACSSALVAVDTACRHLADGSCGWALAGGVNILLDPRMFITFSRAHMLSPTGRIRAFDAGADGFVRGEGVGVVLLRCLEDALAAGDRIHAVIEATAVNQDGRTGTITEPSRDAQIAMLRTVVERAGVAPDDIAYVEAHGTGTPVGDPIEATAIGSVLGAGRDRPLPIGSVKTNIGHLEPAAGIAGLIKAALVLSRGEIPPSLGYERANPAIDLESLGLRVVSESAPLEGTHALVNSFGFGGTNACAVLAAVGWVKRSATQHSMTDRELLGRAALDPAYGAHIPVPLSGPTPQHVEAFAARLLRELDGGALAGTPLHDIASALAAQRDHHEHRAVIIATSHDELRARLECLADGRDWPAADRHAPPQIVRGQARGKPKLVLTMTGQGGQWWAMGRELIEREPIFRAVFESFDRVFQPIAGWSALDALLADEASSRIDDAAITPAVMFAFQVGLAEIWRARGVRPNIVLGHSFGEVTAAYLAGGIGMADVARLVTHRGLIRGKVDRRGTMAAIGLGAEAIRAWLPIDGSIEIGGYNAPGMVTLTGEEAAIDDLIARLNTDDPAILTRKLALDFAYHSSWFEPVEAIFKTDVGVLESAPPRLPVISTVTGAANDDFSADYWWRNLRYPVHYQQAIETALAMGGEMFLEIGPHRTLSSMTAACAAAQSRNVATISTLDRRWGDLVSIAVATAQLWTAGVTVDWSAFLGTGGRDIALPLQPWLLREIWSEPEEAARHMRPPALHPLLGRRGDGAERTWLSDISLANHPWLGDHRIAGTCVMPAAAYIEMLVVAARDALGCDAIELVDVVFPAALYVGSDDEIALETRHDISLRRVSIYSRLRGSEIWELRASARIFAFDGAAPTADIAVDHATPIDVPAFYDTAAKSGYGWGPQFQGLKRIERRADSACGTIEVPAADPDFTFDPRLIDASLQLMLVAGKADHGGGIMPAGIAHVVAVGRIGSTAAASAACAPTYHGAFAATVHLTGSAGGVLHIDRLDARPHKRPEAAIAEDSSAPQFYIEAFENADIVASAGSPAAGDYLVVAAEGCRRGTKIASALCSVGCEVSSVTVSSGAKSAPMQQKLRNAVQASTDSIGRSGIVYVVPQPPASSSDSDPAAMAMACANAMLAFAQAIVAVAPTDAVRLPPVVIVTCRSQAVSVDECATAAALAHSALTGLVRTIAMEAPHLDIRLVDADDGALDNGKLFVTAMAASMAERELVLRGSRAFVLRLVERRVADLPQRRIPSATLAPAGNFALRCRGSVGSEGLFWCETPRRQPGLGEVCVDVRACGLNFRDVMAIAGLLPPGAEPVPATETLGLEVSGIVTASGPDVTDLPPGTHVIGMGTAALQGTVVWPRTAWHRAPAGLSHTDAATLPSAYLTAHYALNVLGRMAPAETVLIHSAAGGVGLAAIALAQRAGARVIATAGADDKRAYLKRRGVEHVLDSRSLAFADEVQRITHGSGVDLVLNALGGAAIDKSLACLAPYGRFLELGKRDVYGDGAVMLKALRHNISLHVIDLAALIRDKPVDAARLMQDVLEMLARKEIAPLPAEIFPAGRVRDAFTRFASAQHIGKIVVDMTDEAAMIEREPRAGLRLDAEGTYLVTGGTSGFGAAVARWLVAKGAGRVVVASRRTTTDDVSADPGALERLRLDVTDAAAVDRAIAELADGPKPLRGIVHAAVVYDDAMLAEQTPGHMARVMTPKAAGIVNLTRAVERTRSRLDFFVSFSSLAQVVGWPGQANYAAANSFLEAACGWQRSRGIPGFCINWGALGESGHVARSGEMQGYLDSAGWIAMSDASALAALEQALVHDAPVLTIAAADWSRLAAAYPAIGLAPRTASLAARSTDTGAGHSNLSALSGAALRDTALAIVRRETCKVLRAEPAEFDAAGRLADAGIDSLSSFELRNRLGQALGIELPMARYAEARTFDALAALVAALVEERGNRQS